MLRALSWLLLVISGCGLELDEPVVLAGQALHADGTPWPGAEITVAKISPEREHELLPWNSSQPWKTVTTRDDGWFFVEFQPQDLVARADTPWGYGFTAQEYWVSLPKTPEGRVSARVNQMIGGDNALPPLASWANELTSVQKSDRMSLSWLPLQAEAVSREPAVAMVARSGDSLLWVSRALTQQADAPSYLFEDFLAPELFIIATSGGSHQWYPLNGTSANLSYTFFWESLRHGAPSGTGAPASRGASCAYLGKPDGPCPLTDGMLTEVVLSEPAPEITFQLDAPKMLSHLLLRGLKSDGPMDAILVIDGSPDGVSWSPLTTTPVPLAPYWTSLDGVGLFVDIPLLPSSPVSRLRIRESGAPASSTYFSGPISFNALREVSFF